MLVGVAGITGAGKTSLLNAILECQEFLPTSAQQASTSVACQISWNDDYAPGHEFRAEIEFCDRGEMENVLESMFLAIQERDEYNKNPELSPEERLLAVSDAEANIEKVLRQVYAVWGYEASAAFAMSSAKILASSTDVERLFGKIINFKEPGADALAQAMKPYLDQSAKMHDEGGRSFAVWPLIKRVHIFLRSEILRNGISLVDLPGLSDFDGTREAVTEEYLSRMAVTVIVSPIHRAADEKTGLNLMNECQELQMQLDGRSHSNSHFVVLSRADELNLKSFLRDSQEAANDTNICELREREKQLDRRYQELNREAKNTLVALRAVERKSEKTKSKMKSRENLLREKITSQTQDPGKADELLQNDKKLKKLVERLNNCEHAWKLRVKTTTQVDQAIKDNRNEAYLVASEKRFRCMSIRNKFVQKRIESDFTRRQERLRKDVSVQKQDIIQVIPASSDAFWKLKTERTRVEGFDDIRVSGIPQVQQSMSLATADIREQHLDMILQTYRRLYDTLQEWSTEKEGKKTSKFCIKTLKTQVQLLGLEHGRVSSKLRQY
jgi:hypothetical protein